MIHYRELAAEEVERIQEIDRSERVTARYRQRGTALELEPVDWRWDGWGHEDLEAALRTIRRCLRDGGGAWGAFVEERLVGAAVLDGRPMATTEPTLDLYFLYVDASYRDRGVGAALVELAAERGRVLGAAWLYVSATSTQQTVEFYQRRGFQPAPQPDPELFALEPEDVHLLRAL